MPANLYLAGDLLHAETPEVGKRLLTLSLATPKQLHPFPGKLQNKSHHLFLIAKKSYHNSILLDLVLSWNETNFAGDRGRAFLRGCFPVNNLQICRHQRRLRSSVALPVGLVVQNTPLKLKYLCSIKHNTWCRYRRLLEFLTDLFFSPPHS